MPVIGGGKTCKMPNLILAYITGHYNAVFLVTLQIMCISASRSPEGRECLLYLISNSDNYLQLWVYHILGLTNWKEKN